MNEEPTAQRNKTVVSITESGISNNKSHNDDDHDDDDTRYVTLFAPTRHAVKEDAFGLKLLNSTKPMPSTNNTSGRDQIKPSKEVDKRLSAAGNDLNSNKVRTEGINGNNKRASNESKTTAKYHSIFAAGVKKSKLDDSGGNDTRCVENILEIEKIVKEETEEEEEEEEEAAKEQTHITNPKSNNSKSETAIRTERQTDLDEKERLSPTTASKAGIKAVNKSAEHANNMNAIMGIDDELVVENQPPDSSNNKADQADSTSGLILSDEENRKLWWRYRVEATREWFDYVCQSLKPYHLAIANLHSVESHNLIDVNIVEKNRPREGTNQQKMFIAEALDLFCSASVYMTSIYSSSMYVDDDTADPEGGGCSLSRLQTYPIATIQQMLEFGNQPIFVKGAENPWFFICLGWRAYKLMLSSKTEMQFLELHIELLMISRITCQTYVSLSKGRSSMLSKTTFMGRVIPIIERDVRGEDRREEFYQQTFVRRTKEWHPVELVFAWKVFDGAACIITQHKDQGSGCRFIPKEVLKAEPSKVKVYINEFIGEIYDAMASAQNQYGTEIFEKLEYDGYVFESASYQRNKFPGDAKPLTQAKICEWRLSSMETRCSCGSNYINANDPAHLKEFHSECQVYDIKKQSFDNISNYHQFRDKGGYRQQVADPMRGSTVVAFGGAVRNSIDKIHCGLVNIFPDYQSFDSKDKRFDSVVFHFFLCSVTLYLNDIDADQRSFGFNGQLCDFELLWRSCLSTLSQQCIGNKSSSLDKSFGSTTISQLNFDADRCTEIGCGEVDEADGRESAAVTAITFEQALRGGGGVGAKSFSSFFSAVIIRVIEQKCLITNSAFAQHMPISSLIGCEIKAGQSKSLFGRMEKDGLVDTCDAYSFFALLAQGGFYIPGIYAQVRAVTFPNYCTFKSNDEFYSRYLMKMEAEMSVDLMETHVDTENLNLPATKATLVNNNIKFWVKCMKQCAVLFEKFYRDSPFTIFYIYGSRGKEDSEEEGGLEEEEEEDSGYGPRRGKVMLLDWIMEKYKDAIYKVVASWYEQVIQAMNFVNKYYKNLRVGQMLNAIGENEFQQYPILRHGRLVMEMAICSKERSLITFRNVSNQSYKEATTKPHFLESIDSFLQSGVGDPEVLAGLLSSTCGWRHTVDRKRLVKEQASQNLSDLLVSDVMRSCTLNFNFLHLSKLIIPIIAEIQLDVALRKIANESTLDVVHIDAKTREDCMNFVNRDQSYSTKYHPCCDTRTVILSKLTMLEFFTAESGQMVDEFADGFVISKKHSEDQPPLQERVNPAALFSQELRSIKTPLFWPVDSEVESSQLITDLPMGHAIQISSSSPQTFRIQNKFFKELQFSLERFMRAQFLLAKTDIQEVKSSEAKWQKICREIMKSISWRDERQAGLTRVKLTFEDFKLQDDGDLIVHFKTDAKKGAGQIIEEQLKKMLNFSPTNKANAEIQTEIQGIESKIPEMKSVTPETRLDSKGSKSVKSSRKQKNEEGVSQVLLQKYEKTGSKSLSSTPGLSMPMRVPSRTDHMQVEESKLEVKSASDLAKPIVDKFHTIAQNSFAQGGSLSLIFCALASDFDKLFKTQDLKTLGTFMTVIEQPLMNSYQFKKYIEIAAASKESQESCDKIQTCFLSMMKLIDLTKIKAEELMLAFEEGRNDNHEDDQDGEKKKKKKKKKSEKAIQEERKVESANWKDSVEKFQSVCKSIIRELLDHISRVAMLT